MLRKKIFICVQGLFVKGDSIGGDAVFQWRALREVFKEAVEVRLFCEHFDQKLHDGVAIEPLENFFVAMTAYPDAVIIYHFCDGWPRFEERLISGCGNLIVRWHNNTPPWFLAKYAAQYVDRTMTGYDSIVRLARNTNCRFWCNSEFTARQLAILNVAVTRIHVVFPASRYIDFPRPQPVAVKIGRQVKSILFVSRVVPHKGHRQAILCAAYAKHRLGIQAKMVFAGRLDSGTSAYHQDLIALAKEVGVELELPGEVDNVRLEELYRGADVFLCLSEHEGFGIPVFEAMRTGLPVLAWMANATAELMIGHPLSGGDLSPRWFAAAMATLQIPEIHDYVLRWQNENVIPRYTKEVIVSQIVAAMEPFQFPVINDRPPRAKPHGPRFFDQRREDLIRDKIAEFYRRIGDSELAVDDIIPKEIPENFVTLYDIEFYRSLKARRPRDGRSSWRKMPWRLLVGPKHARRG